MKDGNIQTEKEQTKTSDEKLSHVVIGNATFRVNVHFGKIPLDDILRQRILASAEPKAL